MANVAASDALKQLLEVFQKKNAAGSTSPQAQAQVMAGQSMRQPMGRIRTQGSQWDKTSHKIDKIY